MLAFAIIVALLFWTVIYLVTRIHKLEIIKNIKNVAVSWLIAILIVVLMAASTYFFGIIIIVIMLHLVLFFVLGDLLYYILRRILKCSFKYNIIGIIVVVVTSGYITYAWFNAFNIKETKYVVDSEKVEHEINIVEIADVHLGTTIDGNDFAKEIEKISEINPDVLVVLGDFVDEDTSYEDMITGCKALGTVKTKYGVYMTFGNHDLSAYGGNDNYTSEEFVLELIKNNVTILQDKATLINNEFYLVGRKDKTAAKRASIQQFINIIDEDKLIILLDHQPVEYDDARRVGVDIMLSGHTHGGQMFPLAYIGKFISENGMTYGMEKRENTTFIVTSGMSEWGMSLKTGAISEYVLITIK